MKTSVMQLGIIESFPLPHGEFIVAKKQLHPVHRASNPVTVSLGKSALTEALVVKARL